jgi:sulfur carrier protein
MSDISFANGAPLSILVNGTERAAAEGSTLTELIELLLGTTRGSAAVVDGDVVPRSEWATFGIRAGQRVELITAVQGG